MPAKIWTVAVIIVLAITATSLAQSGGQFSRRATVLLGDGSVRATHGNVSVVAAWLDSDKSDAFPTALRVTTQGRTFEHSFDFGLNAELLWSPSGERFAITGSEGGANGQYRSAVVTVTPNGLVWLDLTPAIERAFGHPVKCGYLETPNVAAITWLSDAQLVLAAQIINHSNCDSFDTFVAFEFNVGSGQVGKRHDQVDAKQRWSASMGPELLAAPDECVRKPRACYVTTNHPELQLK